MAFAGGVFLLCWAIRIEVASVMIERDPKISLSLDVVACGLIACALWLVS